MATDAAVGAMQMNDGAARESVVQLIENFEI
jgi:hypothetical protein